MADPHRLREVLDNLLENAINYSPEGGMIDVVVQPVQALLPAREASKRERKAEVLSQVELHDGLIWAESCPAGGSAFHVRLPMDGEEKSLTPLLAARGS